MRRDGQTFRAGWYWLRRGRQISRSDFQALWHCRGREYWFQKINSIGRELYDILAQFFSNIFSTKMSRKQFNIPFSIPQRQHLNGNYVKTEKTNLPWKLPSMTSCSSFLLVCGDNPDIHINFPGAAHGFEAGFLDNPQELYLQKHGTNSPISSRKIVPVLAASNNPGLSATAPVKRAFWDMAEKIRFPWGVSGISAAVDHHKGSILAVGVYRGWPGQSVPYQSRFHRWWAHWFFCGGRSGRIRW